MSLVLSEVAPDGVAVLTLNRPDKLNALNAELLDDFANEFNRLVSDVATRCVIIAGSGRAFSVGYDVVSESNESDGQNGGPASRPRKRSLEDWRGLRANLERWLGIWRCDVPVIAAIHGYCMGGATHLAVCCDMTVIAEDAIVGWPSIPLGGGLLGPVSAWLIGPKRAKELSFIAGSSFTGKEAVQMGWANRCVPAEQVQSEARRLASQVIKTPADLLAVKKRAINRIMDVQGFSETMMFGAEYDAIAHDSSGQDMIRKSIREHGMKDTIKWFNE